MSQCLYFSRNMLKMQKKEQFKQRNIHIVLLNKNCLILFIEDNEIWHRKLAHVPSLLYALFICTHDHVRLIIIYAHVGVMKGSASMPLMYAIIGITTKNRICVIRCTQNVKMFIRFGNAAYCIKDRLATQQLEEISLHLSF